MGKDFGWKHPKAPAMRTLWREGTAGQFGVSRGHVDRTVVAKRGSKSAQGRGGGRGQGVGGQGGPPRAALGCLDYRLSGDGGLLAVRRYVRETVLALFPLFSFSFVSSSFSFASAGLLRGKQEIGWPRPDSQLLRTGFWLPRKLAVVRQGGGKRLPCPYGPHAAC